MMPNIVYGKGISGALAYVMGQGTDPNDKTKRLELAPGETSRATVLGGQNFGFEIDSAERLDLARRVMEWQGLPQNQGSKTRKQDLDCLHASLSWNPGETPTRDEMLQAGAEFLKSIGLEKARAVFIAHDDTDHAHIHIVASRIDPETRKTLRVDFDKQAAQVWALEWEAAHGQQREAGQGLHALREAVQGRDVEAVLSHLTHDKATFQAWEINRALQYGGLKGEARDAFRAEIIGHAQTIGLRDTAQEPVNRYTTRDVLAEEMRLQRSATQLAGDTRHGIDAKQVNAASRHHTLKSEQDAALRHLTGAEGISILWGEAGTGKSHTLSAVREAYEGAGKKVIGLSHTNDVVQQMKGDGFDQASTVTRELGALEKGRKHWSRDTVVIVDEAAMLSTKALTGIMRAAERSGAKVILAGDDAQLSSIERGGMFETLRQRHGAAVLREVIRVESLEERQAWGDMHKREFQTALQTFDKAGGVHWTKAQSDTLKEMAARYTADVAADDGKKRFMFAYTNKDVAALNAEARALHKARGDLGEDHTLQTKHGAQVFAEGDRIQFTGNGRKQKERDAGLVNGRVGTIEAITTDAKGRACLTVALDAKKGQESPRLSFAVGEDSKAGEFHSFKHGYAGTVYRGQGRTLDQTYVAYSEHMRASAAYVALTRHREDVQIFAARETVKDLDAMASAMSRTEGKRAATAYEIDAAVMIDVMEEIESSHRAGIAPQAAYAAAEETRGGPDHAAEQAPGSSGIAKTTEATVGEALDSIANLAEKAITTLADSFADLFGGGTTSPTPEQQQAAAEDRQAVRRAAREAAETQARITREQRAAALEKIRRELGADISDEQAEQAARDRGGGYSR